MSRASEIDEPLPLFVPQFNGLRPVLIERPNVAALQVLINHYEDFGLARLASFNGHARVTGDASKTILQAYLNMVDIRGEHQTIYHQGFDKQGRYTAVASNGMGNLPRPIRHTICRDRYVDIDMCNAHFVLLDWLAARHDIPTPRIKGYISDREGTLACYMRVFECPRDDAKKGLLAWVYGRVLGENSRVLQSRNLLSLYNEIKAVSRDLLKLYPEYIKMAKAAKKRSGKTDDNIEGSALSRLCGDVENTALHHIMAVFAEAKTPAGVMIMDGFMVHADDLKGKNIDDLLRAAEADVAEKMDGLQLQLAVKDFDEAIDLSEYQDEMYTISRERDEIEIAVGAVHDAVKADCCNDDVNEKTIAQRLSDLAKGKFVWDISMGSLFMWNGHYWKMCRVEKGHDFYEDLRKLLCISLYKIYAQFPVFVPNKNHPNGGEMSVHPEASRINRTAVQSEIMKQTRMFLRADHSWNDMSDYVQFENATYRVGEGFITENLQDLLINRSNGVVLNMSAPPEQLVQNVQAIEDFVGSIFQHEEDGRFLMKWIAACARKGIVSEEIALFMVGLGGNGKGSIMALLSKAFGSDLSALDMSYYTEPRKAGPDANLYSVRHARIVMSTEASGNDRFQDGKFKTITGGDSIKVRTLYQEEEIEFVAGRVCIQTNNLPKFTGLVDDALRRRVRVLQFPFQFKAIDSYDAQNPVHRLADPAKKAWLMSDEAVAALWWLIHNKYWALYKEEGLLMTESMLAATNEYMADLDEVGQWMGDNVTVATGSRVLIKDLYEQFVCGDRQKMTIQTFGKHLKAAGKYVIRKFNNGLNVLGYVLKEVMAEEVDDE